MKKYIISIIIILSICFINLSVFAIDDLMIEKEKCEEEFVLNNDDILDNAAKTLRDYMVNRQGDIYLTVQTINLNHRWITPRDVFDIIYERAVSEGLSVNPSWRSIFEVVCKELVL